MNEHLKKQQLLTPDSLDDFMAICSEIGALRLHQLLENSKDLIYNKTGTEPEALQELRLVLREMKMLHFYLPK